MRDRMTGPILSFEANEDGWPNPLLREDAEESVRCPMGSAEMTVLRGGDEVQACLSDDRFRFEGMPSGHVVTGAEIQRPDGLLRLDPPELTGIRRSINSFFSARNTEKSRPEITAMGGEVVTMLPTEGVVDFMTDFSEPFIARAVCGALGLPLDKWPILRSSSEAAAAIIQTPEDVEASKRAWSELYDFYGEVLRDKRENPDEAIISGMISKLEAKGLADDEIVSTLASVSNGFPAALPVMDVSVVELLKRPEVVEECLANPECWGEVVNELLRYKAHFAIAIPRIATEGVQLGDRFIPEGTVVLPSLTGATRDPKNNDHPEAFIPGQKGMTSIPFGAGPHFCLGAAMTRQWLEVGLQAFFTKFPDAQLAGPHEDLMWESGSLSAPRRIDVVLNPPEKRSAL